MIIKGRTIAARTIALIAGLIALVVLAMWIPSCLQKQRAAKKQAEVSQGQAGAAIDAGAESSNTLGNVADNAAATDAAVGAGQGEVRAAPEGKKGAATVSAACRFAANKKKPQCQRIEP